MPRAVVFVVCLAFLLLVSPPNALADGFTFTILPVNGNLNGPAGSTIGWGYTLTNNSTTDWLNTISLDADLFLNASVNALFDFPILAPGATVLAPYDGIGSGLYEMVWNPDAPSGFVNAGNFDLTVEWWDGDPLGAGNILESNVHSIVAYSATVTSATSTVPEPPSVLLLASGVGALCWLKRRRASPGVRTIH